MSARFDVTLNQTPNPTLTWRIDSEEWQEGELAALMPLGTGLAEGTHEVTLMARGLNEFQGRWTPPLVSSLTFLGFDVAGGALEMSPRPVRPKIELLGDSITEGVNLWPSRTGLDIATPTATRVSTTSTRRGGSSRRISPTGCTRTRRAARKPRRRWSPPSWASICRDR